MLFFILFCVYWENIEERSLGLAIVELRWFWRPVFHEIVIRWSDVYITSDIQYVVAI